MAYNVGGRDNEVWVNEQGSLIGAKTTEGKWVYYVATNVFSVNGTMLIDHPAFAREISTFNLEVMEAKKK